MRSHLCVIGCLTALVVLPSCGAPGSDPSVVVDEKLRGNPKVENGTVFMVSVSSSIRHNPARLTIRNTLTASRAESMIRLILPLTMIATFAEIAVATPIFCSITSTDMSPSSAQRPSHRARQTARRHGSPDQYLSPDPLPPLRPARVWDLPAAPAFRSVLASFLALV